MSYPTNAVSTELDAVNQILSSVGQTPVTTLDLQNPEVSIVVQTLRNSTLQVLAEGFSFNREDQVKFTPDPTTKEIKYPLNVLSLDVCREVHRDDFNVVRRNGKVYDLKHHTYEFDDPIYLDVVYVYAFEDIPPIVQRYIVASSIRQAAIKMTGDNELYRLFEQLESEARLGVIQYENDQHDYDMFGGGIDRPYLNSYNPIDALLR